MSIVETNAVGLGDELEFEGQSAAQGIFGGSSLARLKSNVV